jgi:hypothetical protein
MAVKKTVATKPVTKSSIKKDTPVVASPKVQEKVAAKPVLKKKATVVEASKKVQEKVTPLKNPIVREEWIAEAAYHLSEARGFVTGYEQEDWNTAEQKYEKEVLVA